MSNCPSLELILAMLIDKVGFSSLQSDDRTVEFTVSDIEKFQKMDYKFEINTRLGESPDFDKYRITLRK